MKGENGEVSFTITQFPSFVPQQTPLDRVSLIPVVIMFLGKGGTEPSKATVKPF